MTMPQRFLIVGVLFFGVLALIAAWRFFGFLIFLYLSSPCGNDIVQEVFAPDRTRRAVVFQRDCGATTGFSTQVAIVWGLNELPDAAGNVFNADGRPDTTGTEVRWSNSANLVIATKSQHDAHKAERHVNGVSVTYERP